MDLLAWRGSCVAVLAGTGNTRCVVLPAPCSLHAHTHLLSTLSSRWWTSLSLFVLDSSQLVMAGEDLWRAAEQQNMSGTPARFSVQSVAGLPADFWVDNTDVLLPAVLAWGQSNKTRTSAGRLCVLSCVG